MFANILDNVKITTPLVHSITNYVTVNDCANIVLACGGSPIMADEIDEVEEITAICGALIINIGTLNRRTIAAMIKAGEKANALGKPVILDPVGAGASALRTNTVFQLLDKIKFAVIRGNISEIKTIGAGNGNVQGVDAGAADRVTEENLKESIVFAKALAKKTGAVIAITGAIDIVADAKSAYIIRNGHPLMGKITGTGCMLSCVAGAFCAANPNALLDAAACAVAAMGLCGELAYKKTEETKGGSATLRMHLIDVMGKIDEQLLKVGGKIEKL